MSYAQLLHAYQALQEHVSALAGAAAVQPRAPVWGHAAQHQLEAVLSSISDAFVVLDRQWRYTYVNDRAAALIGMHREDLLDHNVWDLFPDMGDDLPGRELRRALAEQRPVSFEYFHPTWQRWFENRVYPAPNGLSVFCTDINARKQAEEALHTLTVSLEQRVEERTALLALTQQVTPGANEATSSTAALQYAVDRLCAYTGWPIGHGYLAVAPGANRWAPTTIWHLADPERFTAFQQATQALRGHP